MTRDRYLLEEGWLFHTLTGERDLLAEDAGSLRNQGLLLVGGVDYDANQPTASSPFVMAKRGHSENNRGCSLPYFERLPATREEVEEIASLWERAPTHRGTTTSTLLTGREASEDRVRILARGRSIVHLATHGFVTADNCAASRAGTRGIGGLAIHSDGVAPPAAPLLAGLALAGANRHMATPEKGGDGVLLAEEVVDLDLQGVEWVVLSACDSGVGDIVSGEGVLGLRRAFRLSGAQTLILSLWTVDDRATREWMQQLYRARLTEQKSSVASVFEAALATLEARRGSGRSTSPGFWAAFVAAGDWR